MTRKLISLAVASAIVGAAASRRAGLRAERRHRGAQGAARSAVGQDRAARESADADEEDGRRDAGHCRQDRRRGRAGEVAALSFAGDLRYRNESFDVQYVERNRERDRIRARLNANFRVNDTITGQCRRSPRAARDPRSGNQTLDGSERAQGLRSRPGVRHLGAECAWKVTAGKQRYPLAAHRRVLLRQRHESGRHRGQLSRRAISSPATFYDWLAERALSFGNVDDRHEHRLDHVRRAGRLSTFRSPTPSKLTRGRHVLRLRRRAGLQPVLRRQLVRQHHDDERGGLQPTLAAGTACLLSDFDIIEVLRGSDRLGGRQAAALLRRLRAEHRGGSESGRGREAGYGVLGAASATAPPPRSRAPGNSA